MEHDGGKRLKPKGALSALKQYKYVVLTAALGIPGCFWDTADP